MKTQDLIRKKYIFYAEAVNKAYVLKVLWDALSDSFSRIEFNITDEGLTISRADQQCASFYLAEIKREGFRGYHCKKPIEVSLDLHLLQKLLKNVRRKEKITIFMKSHNKIHFRIQSGNTEEKINVKSEEFCIQCQRVVCRSDESSMTAPSKDSYYKSVVIDSSDFQKIKKLSQEGSLRIKMEKDNYLCISDTDATYSSDLSFGSVSNKKDLYDRTFEKKLFKKTAKIVGLSEQIHFYSPKIHENPEYPLFIKIKIGTYGELSIFIKDESQLKEQKPEIENEEEIVI